MDIAIRADGLDTSEFEKFAVDLSRNIFKNDKLYGFPEGRDEGIDGIDNLSNPKLVIQAKRWQISMNHRTAIKELKLEIDKICKTANRRGWSNDFHYAIVTSVRLGPMGVTEILDYANSKRIGLIPSDDYIVSAGKLNTLYKKKSLLPIFEDYKLTEKNWGRILKEERLKQISVESRWYFTQFNFSYFVESSFFREAYQGVQNNRIILIQGPAGIGKSTTCAMLANLFLNASGGSVHVIVRKVEEINDVIKLYLEAYNGQTEKNLFVIFDDFLGRNYFDVGERVLQDVTKLYSASKSTRNLFICLNSRTQILKEAKLANSEFQRLIEDKFSDERNFIIDLSKYTDIDKAHIFRKTFEKKISEINQSEQVELSMRYDTLRKKGFKEIIKHDNFFPRLVNLIVENYAQKGDFYEYVLFSLNHPDILYENLFNNLKDEEQLILYSLLQFNDIPINQLNLKKAFISLGLNPLFNFEKAAEKLSQTWLSFTTNDINGEVRVQFLNPSIVDFLNDKIEKNFKIREVILEKSVFINQIQKYFHKKTPSFFDSEAVNFAKEKFYNDILNRWESFEDQNDYLGEKLVAMINHHKFDELDIELEHFLKDYSGKWNLEGWQNGWSEVISQIYFSQNERLESLLLKLLEDNEILENILYNEYIQSEELDKIAKYIDYIISDVSFAPGYYATKFSNTNYYEIFKDRKIEFLQEFLDNPDTVSEEDIQPEFYPEYNPRDGVKDTINVFLEKVEEMKAGEYEWSDIKDSDLQLWSLESTLEDDLQDKYDNWLADDSDDRYDEWKELQHEISDEKEDAETVESILDLPLIY